MKIKALLITLGILGTSSVAMARPVLSYSAEASVNFGSSHGPVVRDHRWNPRPAPMPVRSHQRPMRYDSWDNDFYQHRAVVLGEGLYFGDTEYRKDIVVGAQGRFRALELRSDGGATYIMKVVIEFADGGVQQIDINRTLRGYQAMTLDLDGRSSRAFHRIFIYRADGAEAHNMNRRHHGEFTVSAL